MAKLKVVYINEDEVGHNWKVTKDGADVGFIHIHEDESFGGYFPGAENCSNEVWDDLHEQCSSDLADLHLIDRFETQGY